ncbi:hypothetical protein CLV78_102765 [Aliiruegeria haliotis]|uniref:Hemolysin n=1 Tax=Aliiruegeria haliotis TaxID=1280846 RepID=A0A2T0RWL7_9RHOB|nr:DUF333 domain-containing protein [Aliiruegeria haliotis]PRY25585.1 hypothetical protein CLV78_102765 [Aliiruegeria haliotis]
MKRLMCLAAGLALAGCNSAPPANPVAQSVAGAENPAAAFCVKSGWEYFTETTPDGERGICRLPDGTEADAWELFRAASG